MTSRQNDAYLDHAVCVVKQAAERCILVLLAPCYLGYIDPHYPATDRQSKGWFQAAIANGVERSAG